MMDKPDLVRLQLRAHLDQLEAGVRQNEIYLEASRKNIRKQRLYLALAFMGLLLAVAGLGTWAVLVFNWLIRGLIAQDLIGFPHFMLCVIGIIVMAVGFKLTEWFLELNRKTQQAHGLIPRPHHWN